MKFYQNFINATVCMKLKDVILRTISQTQKTSVSIYLFSSIFAFYFPSAAHSGENNGRKGIRKLCKKEVGERRKEKTK